jgi:AraC-like DNA-binding protein
LRNAHDEFQVFRAPAFDDLEFVKVSNQTHVFPRHWHETFVIQVVERGVNECDCRGARQRVSTGSILFINPHEIHTGSAVGPAPLAYRSFYPRPGLLAGIAAQCGGRDLPLFPDFIVDDGALAARFLAAHRACEADTGSLAAQSMLLELFALLIGRHADRRIAQREPGRENAAVKRVTDYLGDNLDREVSLDTLARIAHLSPFHLLRTFRRATGLPPHEYLINLRIERARQLIAAGRSLTDIAVETGFFDSSHFYRHFKRRTGMTPGRYAKAGNFVQNVSGRRQ